MSRLTGFYDWETDELVEKQALWPVVEHFLLIHRGHLLGFIPSDVLEDLDEAAESIERVSVAVDRYLRVEVPNRPSVGYDPISMRLRGAILDALAEPGSS